MRLLSAGKLYLQLRTQSWAEASYYVLHLNWNVSSHSVKQVYEGRSKPTLSQQTLSAVPQSQGEPDKPDLCYLSVSHSAAHRCHETGDCTCGCFCTQILQICCRDGRRFLFLLLLPVRRLTLSTPASFSRSCFSLISIQG